MKPAGNLGKLFKNKDVQDCARKCVATCIRGGEGARIMLEMDFLLEGF